MRCGACGVEGHMVRTCTNGIARARNRAYQLWQNLLNEEGPKSWRTRYAREIFQGVDGAFRAQVAAGRQG